VGEQSTLFGKQYSCTFDGSTVRKAMEGAAQAAVHHLPVEIFSLAREGGRGYAACA